MFTYPIGFMNAVFAGVRPSSVVDTVGAGSIVNSGNAFDADHNNFGVWTPGAAFASNNSVFTVSTVSSLIGKKLYVTWDNNASFGGIQVSMSIDGGANYIFVSPAWNPLSTWDGTPFVPDSVIRTLNISIPDGTPSASIKIKTLAFSQVITDVTRIYDVYIQ